MPQGNNSLETGPYLLSPGTDRVNQAAGVFSGELLWAGVSPLNGKKSIVLSKWKERGPRGGQPETKSIEHPRPNLWPPPFKVPEHHVMLGTVQAESWFDLQHCFLQLDGHWTTLVFPVHFLPTFLPEMWRVKLCLQAGRPGLWFYFCQQLCDLGLHFSIPPSSVSLLNGKQSNEQ